LSADEKTGSGLVRSRIPTQSNFSELIGFRLVSASAERVEATLEVTEALLNRNNVLHGGAVMAFADHLGGTGAFYHMQPGESTVTIESRTNFLRAVSLGDTVTGVCVPLHAGRRTSVWQTTLTRNDGKVVAFVSQTHLHSSDLDFTAR
jgi:uncharacterized protein (TIGR00369 family)